MNSATELRQLAHLLRVGADVAREIASTRSADAVEIIQLADEAVAMAERLDRIAGRPEAGDGQLAAGRG